MLLTLGLGQPARADIPSVGDHLNAIPGQPICSTVDELVAYLRVQLGRDKEPQSFKTCGEMPTGIEFIIVDVSSDDPDVPLRPAKIKIVAPGGASVTGWTVLVEDR
jgi:hypothetical protein